MNINKSVKKKCNIIIIYKRIYSKFAIYNYKIQIKKEIVMKKLFKKSVLMP